MLLQRTKTLALFLIHFPLPHLHFLEVVLNKESFLVQILDCVNVVQVATLHRRRHRGVLEAACGLFSVHVGAWMVGVCL